MHVAIQLVDKHSWMKSRHQKTVKLKINNNLLLAQPSLGNKVIYKQIMCNISNFYFQ